MRTCTVCRHPAREAVNAALVASEPERAIASRFGVSRCALQRHKANHLPVLLTKAVAEAEIVEAETLVGRMETLERKSLSILARAEQAGDLRTALAAIR